MSTQTADAATLATPEPTALPDATRNRILIYLGVLTLLVSFGAPFGGLIYLPVSYFLKNRLHFGPVQVAEFGIVTGIPLYISALSGFIRDNWNPFGIRDRGYMIIFGFACAAGYALAAFAPVSATGLAIAEIALTVAFLFVQAGQLGLTGVIGRQHVMSGQVSALWNAVTSVPVLVGFAAGGFLSAALEGQNAEIAARVLFLVGGVVMAAIAAFALWRPRVVYDNVREEHAPEVHPFRDVVRLAKHWPIYPAMLIWFLWNFSPGSVTPLQFFLQDTLHASDASFGLWNAVFAASFIPPYLLYGWLCRRVKLGKLIFWGTVVGVPQMVPLLFIHTPTMAVIMAAPSGLMGGVCTAAYLDLVIRACPKGLEGTVLMLTTAFYYIVTRLGDLLGTYLYAHFGGFNACVAAITIVYAAILPAILLVPKRLLATADGEAPEGGDFDVDPVAT
jgi:predicted MFS family arabinose efflux permease